MTELSSSPVRNRVHSDVDLLQPPEMFHKNPLSVIIVAGMGPVSLDEKKQSDHLYPKNLYARRNALAAKILATRPYNHQVIMSGYASNPSLSHTEAQVQGDTFTRMTPTFLQKENRKEAKTKAEQSLVEEPQAETTFANIIRSLNLLDKEHDGFYTGPFSVLSSRFHTPRIAEMIKAFGLTQGSVLSAEDILNHFGYEKLDPIDPKTRNHITNWDDSTYENQPAGLQNLQDNPAYVTFELSKIESDQRLQKIASGLKRYYQTKNIELPDCYNNIPQEFDDLFDYAALRDMFSAVKFSKHPYSGPLTGKDYRDLARTFASETTRLLTEFEPTPPKINKVHQS